MTQNSRDREHPVWDVYNLYRTARLNVKYYSSKLHNVQRENFIIEVILAVTLPASAIAGLWFWETEIGKDIWQYLLILSAILAALKPFLKLMDRIQKLEEIVSGYRSLEHDLQKLSISIKQDEKYTQKHKSKLNEALDRKGVLVQNAPKSKTDEKLRKQCRIKVSKELPSKSFYLPPRR